MNARFIAEELRAGLIAKHARSAVLVILEVTAYSLALLTFLVAILLASVAVPAISFSLPGYPVSIGTPEQIGLVVTFAQVFMTLVALTLFILGRFIRSSRKRRAELQALCEAVLSDT